MLRNLSRGRGVGFFEAGGFHATVKEIEKRLGDSSVTLNSFIVSVTSSADMERHWNVTKKELATRNILFQREDAKEYIGVMLGRATGSQK